MITIIGENGSDRDILEIDSSYDNWSPYKSQSVPLMTKAARKRFSFDQDPPVFPKIPKLIKEPSAMGKKEEAKTTTSTFSQTDGNIKLLQKGLKQIQLN